jgi:hypothetical protein
VNQPTATSPYDKILLAKSTNGGASFAPTQLVASINEIPSPLPSAQFRNNSFPTIGVSPQTGTVFIAWSDDRHGDADILFIRSTDGGATWSAPLRVNDDPIGNAHQQFFPWLTVAPNGVVSIGWFDTRQDPNPAAAPFLYDAYVAQSRDDGLTFEANVRVSTQSSDPAVGGFTSFIGDYSGIAATNDHVYPAWVDTRRGNQDIYTNGRVRLYMPVILK